MLLSDATVISLLEADFPEGVPDDDPLEDAATGELEADVLAELERLEELAASEEEEEDDEDDDDRDLD
jgi:hypothetical protein